MSGRARTERRRSKRRLRSQQARAVRATAPSETPGDSRWRRLPTALAARVFDHLGEFSDRARVAQCCRTLSRLSYHPDASEPTELALLVGHDAPQKFALRWVPHRLVLRARPELRGASHRFERLNRTIDLLNRALSTLGVRRRAFASIAFERFATDVVHSIDATRLPPATGALVWRKMVYGSDGDAELLFETLRQWWRYVLANQLSRVSLLFLDIDDRALSLSFSSSSSSLPPIQSYSVDRAAQQSFALTTLAVGNFRSCSSAPTLFTNLTDLSVRHVESPASFVRMCDAIALRKLAVRRIAYVGYRTLCDSPGLARSLRDLSLALDRDFGPPYRVIDAGVYARCVAERAQRRHYNAHLFAPLASLSGLERLVLRVPSSVPLGICDYRGLARLTELQFLRLDVTAPYESLRLPRLPHLVEFHAPHGDGFAFSHLLEVAASDDDDGDRTTLVFDGTADTSLRELDRSQSSSSSSPPPSYTNARHAAPVAVVAAKQRQLNFPALQRLTCSGSNLRLRDLPPHSALQTLHVPEVAFDPDDYRRFATLAARNFPSLVEIVGRDGRHETRESLSIRS